MNHSGYELCQETGTFNSVELGAGTYWINLTNARVGNGDEVYWDRERRPGLHIARMSVAGVSVH